MSVEARLDVLLVTGRPQTHEELLLVLRARGVLARCTARSERLPGLLAQSPAVVMVDLVHPPALTVAGRRSLEGMRGRVLLLALHQGRLDHVDGELSELPVDGYVGASDTARIAEVALRRHQPLAPLAPLAN